MINSDTLHNAGIIPVLDTFNGRLAEAAFSQRLPVVATLLEDSLTLKTESTTLLLTLLHNTNQVEHMISDTRLTAIDESLCEHLDTLATAYPQTKWLPVGRFTAQQLADYMKSPHICAVCDLSFMDTLPAEWDAKCRQLRGIALGYAFAHMGIHSEGDSDCFAIVNTLQSAFGFPAFDIGSSVIVAGSFEITKSNPHGICGHIGIETASVARAINDLQSKGFSLDEGTIQYQPSGRIQSVYLVARIGGFTVHLLQKR